MNRPVEAPALALSGADAVVEMLKAHGVEVIFGLCGDTSLPLYDAPARAGCIRRLLAPVAPHARPASSLCVLFFLLCSAAAITTPLPPPAGGRASPERAACARVRRGAERPT